VSTEQLLAPEQNVVSSSAISTLMGARMKLKKSLQKVRHTSFKIRRGSLVRDPSLQENTDFHFHSGDGDVDIQMRDGTHGQLEFTGPDMDRRVVDWGARSARESKQAKVGARLTVVVCWEPPTPPQVDIFQLTDETTLVIEASRMNRMPARSFCGS
jgi:hypothetical protein